jgi:protein-disulfide isomerase
MAMHARDMLFGAWLAFSLIAGPMAQAQSFSPEQKKELASQLRDILSQDPSILEDALANLKASELEKAQRVAKIAIDENQREIFNVSADPIKGNPSGRIVLVEFFDPRCGYCKALQPRLDQVLKANPDVKLVLKDFPILGPNSILASRALLASQKQGQYIPFQEALMQLKEDPTEAVLRQVASTVGVDWDRLHRDMDDPAIRDRLRANVMLGKKIQVQGTPALVIGDQLIPGAVDSAMLEALITQARARL